MVFQFLFIEQKGRIIKGFAVEAVCVAKFGHFLEIHQGGAVIPHLIVDVAGPEPLLYQLMLRFLDVIDGISIAFAFWILFQEAAEGIDGLDGLGLVILRAEGFLKRQTA